MLQTNTLQREISRKATISFSIGIFLWLALLISGSESIKDQANTGAYSVAFGPLALTTITKHEQSHGVTVTLSFENGLWWYLATWIIAGIIAGLLVWRFRKRT